MTVWRCCCCYYFQCCCCCCCCWSWWTNPQRATIPFPFWQQLFFFFFFWSGGEDLLLRMKNHPFKLNNGRKRRKRKKNKINENKRCIIQLEYNKEKQVWEEEGKRQLWPWQGQEEGKRNNPEESAIKSLVNSLRENWKKTGPDEHTEWVSEAEPKREDNFFSFRGFLSLFFKQSIVNYLLHPLILFLIIKGVGWSVAWLPGRRSLRKEVLSPSDWEREREGYIEEDRSKGNLAPALLEAILPPGGR